ncbi:MAG: extracellular solute-binding protein [Thermoanaerobaculia bacterium]
MASILRSNSPFWRRLGFLGLGAAMLAGLGCGGSGRQRLVLYSPHGPELLEVVEKRYEELHPELDVIWLDMGSQDVFDRLLSEKANPQADVWFGGPDTILAQGAAQGLLAPFRPSWAEAVAPESQHPENLYFGLYRTAPVLAWNSKLVAPADAPADWEDLLAPRFQGKVLLRDPLASGTLRTLFGSILARSVAETGSPERGFGWLARLDTQTREYVLNPALMMEKLARGEGLVTVWELTDMLWQKQRGRPLEFGFPRSGTPVIDDSIGLVARAPHAELAKAFIEWIGSPEAQRLAATASFRLPARQDLPAAELPTWAQKVLGDLVPAPVDGQLLTRESAGWMRRWDQEIRGKGGSWAAKP